jgi:hypothetical protein
MVGEPEEATRKHLKKYIPKVHYIGRVVVPDEWDTDPGPEPMEWRRKVE